MKTYKWILNEIKKLLQYLSITGHGGKAVSLTNVLMLVVIFKVCMTPVISVQELVLLAGALTTYIHRRNGNNKIDSTKTEEPKDEV